MAMESDGLILSTARKMNKKKFFLNIFVVIKNYRSLQMT